MRRKYQPLDGTRIAFEVLSIFDIYTPLFKGIQWLKNDSPAGLNTWSFLIPNTESIHKGWSHQDIKRLLTKNGISVYGDSIYAGQIQIRVPIAQAGKVEDILDKYEIPIKPGSRGAPRR